MRCGVCQETTWVCSEFPKENKLLIAQLEKEQAVLSVAQLCGICDDDAAVWFCGACDLLLCDQCDKDSHPASNRALSRHKRVDVADKPENRTGGTCEHHAGEHALLFCKDDNTVVCGVCVVTTHKGHEFCLVADAVDTQRQRLLGDRADMLRVEQEMRVSIARNGERLEAVEKEAERQTHSIHEEFDRLLAGLAARRAVLVEAVLGEQRRKEGLLVRHREAMSTALAEAQVQFREFPLYTPYIPSIYPLYTPYIPPIYPLYTL